MQEPSEDERPMADSVADSVADPAADPVEGSAQEWVEGSAEDSVDPDAVEPDAVDDQSHVVSDEPHAHIDADIDADIDAELVQRLDEIDTLPLAERADAFAALHTELQQALADIDAG